MCEVTQSCPTLCNPVDCSPPGSSVHGILQARILEWVAISFSRGSSQPRDQTQVSRIGGRRLTSEPPRKPHKFCQKNTLVIANTLFQQHKRRLYTWTSPMVSTKIRLIIFFAAKDKEALHSQEKGQVNLFAVQRHLAIKEKSC